MLSRYMQLPYRPCVGIMLLNRSGLVCVGRRLPECAMVAPAECWQMPQGSIAPAEPAEAGLRVLSEDMGVIRVQVLAEAPGWFTYELPAHLIGIAFKGQYCGQKQKWLAVRFLGDDEEIAVGPRNGATSAWRWVVAADVPRLAPRLKREIYEDVVATFAPFLPVPSQPAPRRPQENVTSQRAAVLPWFVSLFG